ncbi:uncharacterized protein LOC132719527 [Ruditapes philippinarum]|uniref:uncharacterized protein LOC132719527 n=1 Tax=Ruditapes philippinarum TaxID=129788 RepID=UPI00295B7CB3|nr:uncharacterized protein LOC132719527 [Ruditapes philippinarum]
MMDQMDDGDFPQLQVITEFLRTEAENRVVQTNELQLFQCISNCIQDITDRTPGHTIKNPCGEHCISHLTNSDYLKNTVVELLEKHSEQFQPVSDMLVDNVHIQDSDTNKKQVYEMFIVDCKSGSNYQVYIKLLLYAVATCTNTPIYILDTNEIVLHWVYYQPLFSYEEQTGRCIRFITMYMSPVRTFYPIYQHDIEDQRKPKAEGQIGMYLSIFKDIQVLEIEVPSTLLNVLNSFKSTICSKCNREVIKQCCGIFRSLDMIDEETFTRMTTAYRARSESLNMFQRIAEQNEPAFEIICQVLIHRQEKKVLSPYVEDWDSFGKTDLT